MSHGKTNLFSPVRIEKLVKDAGADRVSDDAILDLEEELFNYGKLVARGTILLAKENKRKTVMTEDIVSAMSNVNAVLRQKG